MLQQNQPDDYVIATDETHTVREFLEVAFGHVGLDWRKYVEIDPRYYRPAEVDLLIGDYSKARQQLGWEPQTEFGELVKLMVDADVQRVEGAPGRRIAVKLQAIDRRLAQEILVGQADAGFQVHLRFPAEGEEAGAVHQFARRAVGLGGVPDDLALEADDARTVSASSRMERSLP